MGADEARQLEFSGSAEVERLAIERGLTQAEANILQQLVAGATPLEIALAQSISISTVRTHIARLHGKCGVRRTVDMIRLAMGAAE